MKFILGLLYIFIAQILVWFQLNGQFLWPWFKENKFWVALIFSVPVSLLFIYAQDYLYYAMNEKSWSVRLLSFGFSIVSFFFLSSFLLKETLDTKNTACLILSLFIILIQILWK